MDPNTLQMIKVVLLVVGALGALAGITGVILGAITVGPKMLDKAEEVAKAEDVDLDDVDARWEFYSTNPVAVRATRFQDVTNGVFVGGFAVMVVAMIGAGLLNDVAASQYKKAVAVTLDESYGVTVDHRSTEALPHRNERVSGALILKTEGGAKQCTVASGYSPADLTVVCGGQELLPRR